MVWLEVFSKAHVYLYPLYIYIPLNAEDLNST